MTPRQRIQAIVAAAVKQLGSGQALAARLGVTPEAVTNWKNGHNEPNAHHLVQLQDLVKRAACVLIALGGFTQALTSGDAEASVSPSTQAGAEARTPHDDLLHQPDTLRIVQLCRRLKGWLRRALGFHPVQVT
jgi:transcriptional regulator with XRE-family HTH domain